MKIAFAVTLVLLGITLTANFCARRWLNVAVKDRDKCYDNKKGNPEIHFQL